MDCNYQTKTKLKSIKPTETKQLVVEAEPSPTQKMQQLLSELESLPKIGKRLAIHLEQNARTRLTTCCNQREITPETFIEAAIVLLENHPSLKEAILNEAESRLRLRKRAGYLRRTISMIEGA